MIDVQQLTKTYGAFKAVDRFSFRVNPGEVVGLIGPNGAGKTSTLRCIVGIQSPSAGVITVGGHDIVKAPVEAKRLLAFMADEPQLFEYLTVMEHLRLTGRLYRVRDVESRARHLLAELQLAGKEHALPAELSRGMKQKVAIACGLLHEPKALLFDEPLTGLDPLGIRHMNEEICTRIVIIDHGVKVADATLAELKAHPELAAAGSSLEQIFLTATAGEPHTGDHLS